MTPLQLQADLKRELEFLFEDLRLKNPTTLTDVEPKSAKIKVYEQMLPILEEGEEDEQYPHIIIRLETGNIKDGISPQEVEIRLLIGTFDDDVNTDGHKDVLNIIHKIYERFAKDSVLNKRHVAKEQFLWALQDEDTYPYYFGAAKMTFETATIRREDKYA